MMNFDLRILLASISLLPACLAAAEPVKDAAEFNPQCDFSTITIRDNVIECVDTPRPLLRGKESYAAVVVNNKLVNVSDADKLTSQASNRAVGLEVPLKLSCGVHGEVIVDGWQAAPASK